MGRISAAVLTDNECLIAITKPTRRDDNGCAHSPHRCELFSIFFFFFIFSSVYLIFYFVAKLMKTIDARIVHAFTLN